MDLIRVFGPLLLALAALAPRPAAADEAADEAADLRDAAALFERNIAAIQERDREAYLACYLDSERLVRTGPDGFELGFTPLAEGTAATGSGDWPVRLDAYDLSLAWLQPGLVYGTYRYHVVYADSRDDGISERVFVKTAEGWRIAVSTAFPAAESVSAPAVALVGATVYDGVDAAPIENAVILVRDGALAALGPADEVSLPEGTTVVDVSGRWIVPGLVDAHVHYSQTGWADGRPDATDVTDTYPYPETMAANRAHPERFHQAFLASGVTAVFDVGGYAWTHALGEQTEHSSAAPHVAETGALLSTLDLTEVVPALRLPEDRKFVGMLDEAQVRAAVRAQVATGSDAIKVWYVLRGPADLERFAPLVLAIGDECRSQGVPLVVHATSLGAARIAVEAGAHLLVHSVEDAPVDDAFVQACLAAGTIYCPTLTVRDGYHLLYGRRLSDELRGQLEAVHPSVRERVLATESLPADPRFSSPGSWERMAAGRAAEVERMAANLRRLHAAGVPIAMGTDAGNPLTLHGPSVFPEMEAMQAAGMSPLEVLTAATWNGARAMGRDSDFGRLSTGRLADLIVLTANPAADTRNLRQVEAVMRDGVLHRVEDLRRW